MHQERTYRDQIHPAHLVSYRVVVQETDLLVHAHSDLSAVTREAALKQRGFLEAYIREFPRFAVTHEPWRSDHPAPAIVEDMITAGRRAGVGPMAAVAGAIAEHVGQELMTHSSEIIVENGGDIFLRLAQPTNVGIFAGRSPLSMQLGIRLYPQDMPLGICTSSGTIGHSISHGRADAVVVTADSTALADAAATAIGNRVHHQRDLDSAIVFGQQIQGLQGIVVIIGEDMGAWGQVELVPLTSARDNP